MKKFVSILLLLAGCVQAFSQEQAIPSHSQFEIKGMVFKDSATEKNVPLTIVVYDSTYTAYDSIVSKDGIFDFKFKTDYPRNFNADGTKWVDPSGTPHPVFVMVDFIVKGRKKYYPAIDTVFNPANDTWSIAIFLMKDKYKNSSGALIYNDFGDHCKWVSGEALKHD